MKKIEVVDKVNEAVRQAERRIQKLEKTDPEQATRLVETLKAVQAEVEQANRRFKDPDRKRTVIPSEPC